ncbi:MAG: hypothetical protein PHC51_00705 [bacterium]|nr:hypothetical protein [bacterium]
MDILCLDCLLPCVGDTKGLMDSAGRLAGRSESLNMLSVDSSEFSVEEDEREQYLVHTAISQAMSWIAAINGRIDFLPDIAALNTMDLTSLYALARLYFRNGYIVTSERVFSGLQILDKEGETPADLGCGVVALCSSKFEEAIASFHKCLSNGHYLIESQLGLTLSYIGLSEMSRAVVAYDEITEGLDITTMKVDIRPLYAFVGSILSTGAR